MWPWTTKPVLSRIFVAIANIVWGQNYDFFYAKNQSDIKERSCSKKIFCKFPTVNISKLNFWLVIGVAKNFILTTLKAIFSIFLFFFAPLDSRFSNSCFSAKYCPILTNHTLMEILFIQFICIIDPYDWFCGPGSHIWCSHSRVTIWVTKLTFDNQIVPFVSNSVKESFYKLGDIWVTHICYYKHLSKK